MPGVKFIRSFQKMPGQVSHDAEFPVGGRCADTVEIRCVEHFIADYLELINYAMEFDKHCRFDVSSQSKNPQRVV
jgi:hypothetical protein